MKVNEIRAELARAEITQKDIAKELDKTEALTKKYKNDTIKRVLFIWLIIFIKKKFKN